MAGRLFEDLLPDWADGDKLLQRVLDTGQSFGKSVDFSVPQRDFDDVHAFCRVSLSGELSSCRLIVELFEMTQWRQFDREKALIKQRGASRRIIRQLAHEIRNPLGGLRGAAQLLERELKTPELREYTRVIIKEADRLAALTKNLLGPTTQPSMALTNIHELIEHVFLLIESEAPQGINIVRDYDPSLPDISLDRDQIIQSFLNIARNAVQSLGDTGTLTIRTRVLTNFIIDSKRHRLVISVEFEDTGPGIADEIADSIFYPLFTDREGGTGLGLPLAQDLVSRHGGLIEFESSPGQTVFMVRLPINS